MSRLIKHVLAAGTLLLGISSGAFANDFSDKHWNECSLDTLEGTYLFSRQVIR